MGIFSKIADVVTGGGVKVHLQWSETALGKPIEVRVKADTVKSDKDITEVYVRVMASEKVTVPKVNVAEKFGDQVRQKTEDVSHSQTTFDQKFPIAGAQSLKAGQTYEWTGSVTIPADVLPSYRGVNASHTWKILAGLGTRGNDPDSGWFEITLGR